MILKIFFRDTMGLKSKPICYFFYENLLFYRWFTGSRIHLSKKILLLFCFIIMTSLLCFVKSYLLLVPILSSGQ